jgi:hypothetical protein
MATQVMIDAVFLGVAHYWCGGMQPGAGGEKKVSVQEAMRGWTTIGKVGYTGHISQNLSPLPFG